MNNHYAWRTAVLSDNNLDNSDKVYISVIGDCIDWHTGCKEFRSRRHLNNWIGSLCDRYNADEDWLIDAMAAAVSEGYLTIGNSESGDALMTLHRTLPGVDKGE